ncbi:hypothetical protein EWM64_g7442, partial [Hericium alpestre]
NHGKWHDKRRRETECEDEDPKVLIIGAGQSGLDVAARLKYLGVKTLIVDKEPRIGNLWRKRYEALCLHDTVCQSSSIATVLWSAADAGVLGYDHMPYLPFPPTWPVYTPAPKLADWLENYAHVLELDVWLSTNIISVKQDPETHKWTVSLRREDGKERTFVVNHLVFAIGLGGGTLRMPSYPGADEFQGKILHSGDFTTGRDYMVIDIPVMPEGHDISKDLYDHGVDVTLFQRGSTYVMSVNNGVTKVFGSLYHEGADPDVADLVNASFPNWLNHIVQQRVVKDIAELDKETLDGLHRVGFRTNDGIDGSGFGILAWSKAGGYYLDVGASQLIIDGKIKLKNDAQIKKFTKDGLEFENGSKLEADTVIFATGYGDSRDPVKRVIGEELGKQLKPIWGLDAEGEINSVWRDSGIPNMYVMMGNLALCRFHSRHIALQIKAVEKQI